MALSKEQRDYLDKRRKILRFWPFAGPFLPLGIAGLAIHLYVNTPLLIDPYEVLSRIEAHSIKQSSLEIMAVMLPITFIAICFLLVMLVVVMYAAFANERRYLEIVGEMERGGGDGR